MENIIKLDEHQILLVHSKTDVGYIIQFGMNLQRWLHCETKPFWKKIYNHSGIGLGNNVLAEAIGGGVTIQDADVAYRDMNNRHFAVYQIPNSEHISKEYVEKYAKKYNGIRYQFMNFLQWSIKILFGFWIGKKEKKSEDKLYCQEFTALMLYKVYNIEYFKEYWKASPTDVQEYCENYCKLVYYNEI